MTLIVNQNSKGGHLSTPQLRLAYAALVRGACSNNGTAPMHLTGDNLAWYCIMVLTGTMRELSSSLCATSSDDERRRERLHRLHLTLISTVPSLSLKLMMRVLEEILVFLKGLPQTRTGGDDPDATEAKRKKELIEALFGELVEGVGDREKEAAMQWWYQHEGELEQVISDPGEDSGVAARL